MTDKGAPQNLDAERQLLGACMISQGAIDDAVDHVTVGDFYYAAHAAIFQAVVDLARRGEGVDPVTVIAELDREGRLADAGGEARVKEIAATVVAVGNAARHARLIAEAATLRGILRVGQEAARLVYDRGGATADALLDRVGQMVFDLSRDRQRTGIVRPSDILADTLGELTAIQERGGGLVGLSSGLADVDRLTAGFQAGNLVVLGARPAMGKSSMMFCTLADASVKKKVPTLLFTFEMNRREVIQRLLALLARVDLHKLRTGKLDLAGWGRVHDAGNALQQAPLFIDDSSSMTALEIRSKARQVRAKHPDLALVAIDYLQLIAYEGDRTAQEVSKIARTLKVLAGELDVPVLALSQLNRQVEQRHDKRPNLSDTKESGGIEESADVVLLLYREEQYFPDDVEVAGIAEVNVAKQRNGPTGVVKVQFEKRFASFSDLARKA